MGHRLAGVGYEGRSIDELVTALLSAGVGVVVDVRENAVSRRPGFSRRRLEETLGGAGIRYFHEPALGNPRDNRAGFRAGEPSARRRYEDLLANGAQEAVDRVIDLAGSALVGLLCYEHDPATCHRSYITALAASKDPELRIIEV